MIAARFWVAALWLGLASGGPLAAVAAPAELPGMASEPTIVMSVAGLSISLGRISGEQIDAHSPTHPEAPLHAGEDEPAHAYHVVVALHDAASGQPVRAAQVTARVEQPAGPPVTSPLRPMPMGREVWYGNYLELPRQGPYRITVSVTRPGTRQPVRADFDFPR